MGIDGKKIYYSASIWKAKTLPKLVKFSMHRRWKGDRWNKVHTWGVLFAIYPYLDNVFQGVNESWPQVWAGVLLIYHGHYKTRRDITPTCSMYQLPTNNKLNSRRVLKFKVFPILNHLKLDEHKDSQSLRMEFLTIQAEKDHSFCIKHSRNLPYRAIALRVSVVSKIWTFYFFYFFNPSDGQNWVPPLPLPVQAEPPARHGSLHRHRAHHTMQAPAPSTTSLAVLSSAPRWAPTTS